MLEDKTYADGDIRYGYVSGAREGALVVDARATEDNEEWANAFAHHTYTGPMVKVELPPGTIHRLMDKGPVKYDGGKLGSMDFVSLDIYESLVRALPGGVRIGRVAERKVKWDDEH
jgi:hypothetical protein